jgi:hypothetical protein
MRSRINSYVLVFSICVSVFGLIIALMVAFNPPTSNNANLFWRKPLVGLVFGLVCTLGVSAALFPKRCSGAFHFPKASHGPAFKRISGASHHPDCKEFSTHVIRLRNHTLCAACTGLLIGALIALVGTALYFFGGWHIEETGLSIVLIGETATSLGFSQAKFKGFVRVALNASFVIGAFLILVGIDELAESVLIDLFITASIVFWILTRIQLSQWDHWRICSRCESTCEVE